MDDLVYRSAGALARAVGAGEVSAVQVLEAHVARLEAVNPTINAVVCLDLDRARARAREADAARERGESWGPLHGVPFTVKDVFSTRGMPTTVGVPWISHQPDHDAALVRQLVEAGGILFGKTNLPLGSYDWQCRDSRFGVCNNPHDPSRVPGGSSSGSAAAVAAGITPFELGSDVAGSIRVPAAFCGVVGLRPTEGLLDTSGHAQLPDTPHAQRITVCGPIARSVADIELLLPILAGGDGHSMSSAPLPPALAPVEASQLRVAWSSSIADIEPAQGVRSAIEAFRARLLEAGVSVESTPAPFDAHEAMRVWGCINGAELITMYPAPLRWWPFRWLLRSGLVGLHFGFGHFSRALARGYTAGMGAYMRAQTQRDALISRSEAFLTRYDAWICPSAPVTAFTHRKTGSPLDIDGRRHCYADALGFYNCPIAALGVPVVTIPVGQDPDGLPVGIQIVGARFTDARLLRVAAVLERVAGGFVRPPAR